jgi:hypothetical protein
VHWDRANHGEHGERGGFDRICFSPCSPWFDDLIFTMLAAIFLSLARAPIPIQGREVSHLPVFAAALLVAFHITFSNISCELSR